jgi:hypothetical protein
MKFKSKFTAFFMAVQLLGFSQTEAKNQSKKAVQSPLKESNPLAAKSITARHYLSKRGYSQRP